MVGGHSDFREMPYVEKQDLQGSRKELTFPRRNFENENYISSPYEKEDEQRIPDLSSKPHNL